MVETEAKIDRWHGVVKSLLWERGSEIQVPEG